MSELSTCPTCAEYMEDGACRFCTSKDPSSEGSKKCPMCAEVVKASAKKCRFCGEILDIKMRVEAENLAAKSKIIFQILAFFLGGLGIHNFYIGRYAVGALQLCLTLFTGGIGLFVVIPWVLVEIFVISKDSNGKTLK